MTSLRRRITVALLAAAVSSLVVTPARAQIDNETLLDTSGYGAARVHNASADVIDVVVELRHGSVTREAVTLGAPVDALVSPARFHLGPGETQTVRLLVRERLPADSVVRLVTTLTPRPPAVALDTATAASARLIFATRLVTRVRSR